MEKKQVINAMLGSTLMFNSYYAPIFNIGTYSSFH
jgi:hypothetical protein